MESLEERTVLATLVVVNETLPDSPQDFAYTSTGGLSPATFSLDDDGGSGNPLSKIQIFTNVAAGAYTVTSTPVGGFALTALVCHDTDSTTDLSTRTASLNLSDGETVVCTFAHTKLETPGTIVIVKDTVPNDAQDFSFSTLGGLSPASFSLDDDDDGTLSNTQTYSGVAAGTYTVSETPVAGFALTGLNCDDPDGGTTVDQANGTVSIDLDAGETITCTFENTKLGTIVVVKDTLPDDAQDFEFSTTGGLSPESFSLDDDDDATLSNTRTYTDVVPGTYTVAEAAVDGFSLSALSCVDPDGETTTSLGNRTASIDLDPGETITCTFENTKLGTLIIVKDTVPDDAQDFAFTTTGGLSPADFLLDDDADGTLSNTQTYQNLNPGAYTVAESAAAGFALRSLICVDPDDGTTTSLADRTASIDLDPGETITCTFENTRLGSIVIVKDTVPNDAQDFSFTTTGGLSPQNFSLDDDDDGTLSNAQTYSDVPAGSYTVAEAAVAGFELTALTCVDPDGGTTTSLETGTATIDLDAGETITCTFENTKLGTIVIVKDTVPDDVQDFAFTTTGGLSPADFSLDDDTDGTLANVQTYTGVSPGAYTVAESAVSGFVLSSLTCVDPDDGTTTNLATGTASIDLDAGETITCTFENTKLGTIVIIKDTVPNDAQDFAFTTTGGLSPETFSLDDDDDGTLTNVQTYTEVHPGTYTVAEAAVAGFALTGLTCIDPDNGSSFDVPNGTATIDLDAGETITCTFENTKLGTIVVTQNTVPDDPQDFAYSIGGSLTPANFMLDDDSDGTLANVQAYQNVAPGTYPLAQTPVPGFSLTDLTCVDPDDGSSTNAAAGIAVLDLDPGETITCSFENTKLGTIVIIKDTIPNDAQDFEFSSTGGLSPANFNLDDDDDAALSNVQTFTDVVPGDYTIAEAAVPGFELTALTCVDPDGGTVTNTAAGSAAIDLDAGETVTCTFENTKLGTIIITKNTVPDDGQDFSFAATGGLSPDTFMLDDDADLTLPNVHTYSDVSPGTYTVAESAVSGFLLTALTCTDPDDGTVTVLESGSAVIDVDPGETIVCSFENTKLGTLIIVKDTIPDDPQDFSYATTGGLIPANFILDDDADATRANSQTFHDVLPGNYTVAEAAVAGFKLTAFSCVDPDGGTTTDTANGTAAIDMDPGETITCTFENTKLGKIVIVKDTLPDDPQDFAFATGGGLSLASFELDDDGDATLSNTQVFDDVLPGSYSVTEAPVAGFALTALDCVDPDGGTVATAANGTVAIDLDAGETITCTFENTKLGTIIIVQDTVPNDAQDFDFVATGGLAPANFSLDDDSDGTLSNAHSYNHVIPGNYTVASAAVAGFELTSLDCADPDGGTSSSLAAGTATLDLDPGETITCTFERTKLGTIVVLKNTLPDDPQDFAFSVSGGLSPANFSLDDDADNTLSSIQTYTDVIPGNYTVTESPVSGFKLTDLTCVDPDGGTVTSTDAGFAHIDVDPGETVVCTFENTKLGTIVIIKDAVPDGAQDFLFMTMGGLSPAIFSLDDDGDATLSNVQTYDNVLPGQYTVAEAPVAGFARTSLTCVDPDNGTTTDLANGIAAIDVDPGETVTCTFVNTKQGTIVIIKDTVPDDPQDFTFTTTGGLTPSTFKLDDDSNATLSNTQTYNHVTPGAYKISEAAVTGFELIALSCIDPDGGTTTNLSNATVTIDLDPGETITCTFRNSSLGKIVIVKDTVPNNSQDFAFTATGGLSPANFSLDDDADPTLSNTQTYNSVAPGVYTISEGAVAGYKLTSLSCVDPDGGTTTNQTFATATIDVDPGETITCTFRNTRQGTIVIIKDTVPNDPQDFVFTASGGLSPASFVLDDDSNPTFSRIHAYTNVTPGTFTITEAAVAGFPLTDLFCIDPDGGTTADLPGRSVALDVDPGETVICMFRNTRQAKVVIVKDTVPDDPQDFLFAASGGLSPASFKLDDDANPTLSNTRVFHNVAAGAYTVAEAAVPGFELSALTCTDPDNGTTTNLATGTAVIDVDAGETITCTFENTKLGSIVIIKDTVPDDAQDFAFTTTGGLTPTSFDLDDDADGTLPNTQTYLHVTPGAYTVAETAVNGFKLTALTCADPDNGTTTSLATRTAAIDLDAGETVICTFENTKDPAVGNIVIVKDTIPDHPQDFAYVTTGGLTPSGFELDDDADGTLSNTQAYQDVTAGTYTITETPVSGFQLTKLTCVDPDGGTTTHLANGSVSIDLDADETVTCTFENTQLGNIVIVKDTVPDHPQDFAFTTTGGLTPVGFSLDDDGDPTLPNTQTYANVLPGTYTVTETPVAGFTATVDCVDPDGGSSTSGATATADLDSGETITCTFTNTIAPPEITELTVSATLEEKALPEQTVTLAATFTHTNLAAPHTAKIDWDDGTVTDGVVDQVNGTITGTHEFATGGTFAVTVTVTDSLGQTATETETAFVTGARLTEDGDLQLVGTDGKDDFDVELDIDGDDREIHVKLVFHEDDDDNEEKLRFRFDADKLEHITAYLCDGDDDFKMSVSDGDSDEFEVDAEVHGGPGKDEIDTLAGNDIVFGDEGDDEIDTHDGNDVIDGGDDDDNLDGGNGRDLIIGGPGKDRLKGDDGDDILIGGFTVYDENLDALALIMAEWTSDRTYLERVHNLRNAAGPILETADIEIKLDETTVFNDGVRDKLEGDDDRDWFFANLDDDEDDDKLEDRKSGERLN